MGKFLTFSVHQIQLVKKQLDADFCVLYGISKTIINFSIGVNMFSKVGGFELDVLMAILDQNNEKVHGRLIVENLNQKKQTNIAYGRVYTALERLEKKGYVNFKKSKPEKNNENRERYYFEVNGNGKAIVTERMQRKGRFGIPALIESSSQLLRYGNV